MIFTNEIAWFVSCAAAASNFSSDGFQNLSVSNTSLYFFNNWFEPFAGTDDKPSCEELVAGEKIATLSLSSAVVMLRAKIGPLDKHSNADLWKNIFFFSNDLSIPPNTCTNCSASSINTGVL